MSDTDQHEAIPRAELERQIMDSNIPKNEREWWAAHEIERLTALHEAAAARAELAQIEIGRLQLVTVPRDLYYHEITYVLGLKAEIARLKDWALDEQAKCHKAEEDRMNARSEVERLRTQCGGNCRYWEGRWRDEKADNDRLRIALQALHDHNVEYARINNLFNGDGTPATFHELLQARAALEPKP